MLEINSICIWYGDVQVIFDVSIKVEAQEIVSVIGANGVGKSTLLKAISGVIPVRAGTIEFEGKIINTLRAYEIVKLGIIQVPEGRGIFPSLTVLENLEMGSYTSIAKIQRKESTSKVFRLFPILQERKGQLAGTLSGGEQQMLAIGRGLMSLPKMLLLDEPSMGLSPIMLNIIMEAIVQVNREKTAILLVEQNVFRSLSISHKAYTLENGFIGLEGGGKTLLNNPHILKAYMGI